MVAMAERKYMVLRPKFRSSEPEWPRNHLEDLGFLHIQLHQWQSDWAGALAVTVEDKDPSVLWAQTQRGVFVRWINMLLPQPRWKFVNLKPEEVLKKYRDLLNTCLPRSLAP